MIIKKTAALLLLVASTVSVYAASSSYIPEVDTVHVYSADTDALKDTAYDVLLNYFGSADKTRFDAAKVLSGEFGSVVIPQPPQAGDYVVKFSTDESESYAFQGLNRLLADQTKEGFLINFPVAIGDVYGNFSNIQILPYVVNGGDSLVAKAMQQVVLGTASEMERQRIKRLGRAMGLFQDKSFDSATKESLSHGDCHPWNVLDDHTNLTLIDVGTMKKASIHTDPFYLLFKGIESLQKNASFKDNLSGYEALLRAFYQEYIDVLSPAVRDQLKADYVGQTAFLSAKEGTQMIFDRPKDAESHDFTAALIEMQNRIVQELLAEPTVIAAERTTVPPTRTHTFIALEEEISNVIPATVCAEEFMTMQVIAPISPRTLRVRGGMIAARIATLMGGQQTRSTLQIPGIGSERMRALKATFEPEAIVVH